MKDEWLGHSHGGWASEIHLCVEGHGLPLSLLVTSGQCNDVTQLRPVLDTQANQGRNVVERGIDRLKDIRVIATGYDKRGQNYLAGAILAVITL